MQVRGFVRDDGLFDILVRHPVRTLLPSKLVRGCTRADVLDVVSEEARAEEDIKTQLRAVKVGAGQP